MKLADSKTFFNALADETRLRILNLLSEGELCVCDLIRVLKEPQSKISRHLAYLRRARLVESRKKGLWMHYRLAPQSARISAALLRSLQQGRRDFAEFKKDLKEFNRCKGSLAACCN